MKLADLDPTFLVRLDDKTSQMTDEIGGADGVQFLCPVCFEKNGGRVGTHAIICWAPHVPQTVSPKPGRWELCGTGYSDLTLVGKPTSSVLLMGPGCGAHFHVTNGEIV